MNSFTLQYESWQVLLAVALVPVAVIFVWKVFWWTISHWPMEKDQ